MLTNEKGEVIGPKEGVYTHHFISMNIEKEGLVPPIAKCATGDSPPPGGLNLPPGQKMPFSTFIGRGEDGGLVDYLYTSPKGAIDYGYHLRKGDKILVNADLVNYQGDQKQLFLTYEIEYVDGIRGLDASSGLLSVGGKSIAKSLLHLGDLFQYGGSNTNSKLQGATHLPSQISARQVGQKPLASNMRSLQMQLSSPPEVICTRAERRCCSR
jgi:hypothetical protein